MVALIACFGCGTAPASRGALVAEESPAGSAPQGPAECRTASGGSYLGSTDRNPSNAIPQPKLGTPLISRRDDGHLEYGMNDQSFFARSSTPRIGLNGEEDTFAHHLVGSSLIRITLNWGWVARNRGTIEWGETDRVYCDNVRRGIAPIFTILASPKWAVIGGQRCDGYCFTPPEPSYYPDLRDFATQAAIRYPRVAAIEAWNEPNLDVFWGSRVPGGAGPDPARYTEVLRAIFEGVKSGHPSTPVLGGSLANIRNIAPGPFLSGMYDAGARRWMDGLSFHPYPNSPRDSGRADTFHEMLQTVRSLVASRDPGRRLWPDEVGAGIGGAVAYFTEEQQSSDLLAVYRELDEAPDVDAVVFHSLIDDNEYGWLKPRNSAGHVYPRPVYCAFVDRFGALAEGDTRSVATLPATKPAKKKAKKKKRATRKHRAKRKRTKAKRHSKSKRKAKPRAKAARMDCAKPLQFS
jgi:hypothetical protein